MGLGDDETIIGRLRRASAGFLTINDNNDPVALDLGTYFGGDGDDLTLYIQTAEDGLVSFLAADQLASTGDNWANFGLLADAQALLNNLAAGDRFIFASRQGGRWLAVDA